MINPGLMWAAAGAVACAVMAPLEPSLLEEGLIVHFAERMAHGEHLYRDLVWFTGPLPYELLAALFRIFGEAIIAGRVAVVLLHAGATASVYGLARLAGAGALAHAAALATAVAPPLLFPLFSILFYSTVAVHLALIAAYAAARGIVSPGWMITAGALVAATTLTKQNVGLLLAASLGIVVALVAPRGRRLGAAGAFVAGGLAAAVATLAYYAARGDLGVFVHSLVVLPLSLEETFSRPYVNLWPPGRFLPPIDDDPLNYVPSLWTATHRLASTEVGPAIVVVTQLLFAMPIVAVIVTTARRLAGPLPIGLWAHTAALAAVSVNLFPRSDWAHLALVLPSALGQLLIVAGTYAETRAPRAGRRLAVGLATLLGAGAISAAVLLYRVSEPPRLGPRVPLRPVTHLVRSPFLARVIEYLRRNTRPGEAIFVPRSEPLIYFATGMRNPTPYGGVFPGMREEQERNILAGLDQVRFVVMTDLDQPIFTYYRDELPAVQAYLERYFEVSPVSASQWLLLLERRPDRGASAVDLIERLPEARAWVRNRSGAEEAAADSPPRLPTVRNRRPLAFRLGRLGGGVDFDVTVPDGAVFQGDVGFGQVNSLHARHRHPDGVRLVVSVGHGGGFQAIGEARVDLRGQARTAWRPLEADLSAYAGERVALRLELIPDKPLARDFLAWWGSPRIALRPASPGSSSMP